MAGAAGIDWRIAGMLSTLKPSSVLGSSDRAMWVVLAEMILVPVLIRRVKAALS